MKKFFLFLTISMLAVLLFGCGSSNESGTSKNTSGKVTEKNTEKQDFEKYLKNVQPVLSEMGEYAQSFDNLRQKSANGELTDQEFGQELVDNILPNGVKISEKVENIIPPKKIRSIHEKLIDMMAKNHEAMTELVSAVDNGDASKITSANDLLSEARKLERDYTYDLQDTAKEYNIDLEAN